MRLMVRNPRIVSVVRLLLLDTVMTGLVGVMSTYIAIIYWQYEAFHTMGQLRSSYAILINLEWLSFIPQQTFTNSTTGMARWVSGVYFYSALLPSLWVWLFVVASGFIKVMRKAVSMWTRALPFLDTDAKPLSAIGKVAGVLVGLGYLGILGVILAIQHVRR